MGSVGVRRLASLHSFLGAMAGLVWCSRFSSNMAVVRAMLVLLSFCCRRRHGRYGPEGQLLWHVQGWLCRLRCTLRFVRFPGSQAHDDRHHGRYSPDGQLQWHVEGWYCW